MTHVQAGEEERVQDAEQEGDGGADLRRVFGQTLCCFHAQWSVPRTFIDQVFLDRQRFAGACRACSEALIENAH